MMYFCLCQALGEKLERDIHKHPFAPAGISLVGMGATHQSREWKEIYFLMFVLLEYFIFPHVSSPCSV